MLSIQLVFSNSQNPSCGFVHVIVAVQDLYSSRETIVELPVFVPEKKREKVLVPWCRFVIYFSRFLRVNFSFFSCVFLHAPRRSGRKGSGMTLFLQLSSIVGPAKATLGETVDTKFGRGVLQAYSIASDTYTVALSE